MINRRQFIAMCTGLLLTQSTARCAHSSPANQKGKVMQATNPSFFKADDSLHTQHISTSLHQCMKKLLNAENDKTAWSMLFNPGDRVGLKVNCLASPKLSPHPELIKAIIEGLLMAGVKEENILIWDRSNKELERGNFQINTTAKGVKYFGTDAIEGGGYEQQLSTSGKISSCLSMILTQFCTALINVPVLKDHDLAGIGVAMKNLYGIIHNPNKYHDNNCNPYLADVCNLAQVKDKLRLTICDGLIAQYNGGPAFKPQWKWNCSTLLVAQDMVALDSVAYDIIEKKRASVNMPSLKAEKREPSWLKTAEKYNLGYADLSKITLESL